MKIIAAFATAGLLALCLLAPSDAADCHRNRSVFCPTAATYAAPTYNAVAVAHAVEYVPVAVAVPVYTEFAYSLSPYLTETLVDAAAFRAAKLLNQSNVAPQRPAAPPVVPAAAKPGPVSMAPGGDEPTAALAKVVGDSCIRCHSAAKASGGLDLSNLSAVPELERFKIAAYVLDGTMPKGGQNLPDEQAQLFFAWAKGFKTASR